MARVEEPRTSQTLLGRLRESPTDQAAWAEFVQLYGPKVYAWCRHWHLQEADAQDVTQTVLVKPAQKMRTFAYDPSRSFRGWLQTLTRHALSDFLAGRGQAPLGTGDSQVRERLNEVEAREDLLRHLQEQFGKEKVSEKKRCQEPIRHLVLSVPDTFVPPLFAHS